MKMIIFSLVLAVMTAKCNGAKVLIYPFGQMRNSHSINMEKMATLLAENGHEVHMLTSQLYSLPDGVIEKGVKRAVYQTQMDKMVLSHNISSFEDYFSMSFITMVQFLTDVMFKNCDMILNNTEVLESLRQQKFDIVIMDICDKCVKVLASYFDRPRISFHSQGLSKVDNPDVPEPWSYVPTHLTAYTDNMRFTERLVNVLTGLVMLPVRVHLYGKFESLAQKYGITMKDTEVLRFIYDDFSIAYLSPIMPDMVLVGGAFLEQPNKLDTDLELFMQSAGDPGVIIISFGSVIKNYGSKWSKMFADVFSRLQQKVLWRYSGVPPNNLGSNTKLMAWLPQTDLLGHPKTKAFITHCGMNSAYEAAFYGVPVVAIPLNADQPHNAGKLCFHHQMGVSVNARTLTAETLHDAITEVITNPKYKQNAVKVSNRFKEEQTFAKDKILYWVDYVYRNNGSQHLISRARQLPFYQYYYLDIVIFLLSIITTVSYVFFQLCIGTCKYFFQRNVKHNINGKKTN